MLIHATGSSAEGHRLPRTRKPTCNTIYTPPPSVLMGLNITRALAGLLMQGIENSVSPLPPSLRRGYTPGQGSRSWRTWNGSEKDLRDALRPVTALATTDETSLVRNNFWDEYLDRLGDESVQHRRD